MARSVDMRGAINSCTTPRHRQCYALIDGKLYCSTKGKSVFTNQGYIKQSLRFSRIYDAVRTCADNYCAFLKEPNVKKIREKFWKEFLKERVKFYHVDLVEPVVTQ